MWKVPLTSAVGWMKCGDILQLIYFGPDSHSCRQGETVFIGVAYCWIVMWNLCVFLQTLNVSFVRYLWKIPRQVAGKKGMKLEDPSQEVRGLWSIIKQVTTASKAKKWTNLPLSPYVISTYCRNSSQVSLRCNLYTRTTTITSGYYYSLSRHWV